MIPLDGRVLLGLDEFMLRYGHLRVLCSLASENKLTLSKLEKKTSEKLMNLTDVPEELEEDIAFYLKSKSLCLIEGKTKETARKKSFRYPDLILKEEKKDTFKVASLKTNERPKIWWQDLCLSSSEIVSGVGAVTADLKTHTGLSHVIEWSQKLGLLGKTGKLSPYGRLVAKLNDPIDFETNATNPYMSKQDILIIGFSFLSSDMDVFSRLIPKILDWGTIIKRQDAQKLFRLTVEDIAREAKNSKLLGARQKSTIMKLYKDLKKVSGRRETTLEESSTAWHRASSRFETYVELGFLEKFSQERLSFIYRPTDKLRNAADLISKDYTSSRDWLEDNLTELITGTKKAEEKINSEDLMGFLPTLLSVLKRPTESFPINAICLGIVFLMSKKGRLVKINAVRKCIETLSREYPDSARLMRGRIGNRAEFVSFNTRKL